MSRRPEATGEASLFYNSKEARKYNSSSRMIGVQREITVRAMELLRLPSERPCLVLDVGCGSGLSGQALEEAGHLWVGLDVSRDMLDVARERIEGEEDDEEMDTDKGQAGDLLHHDMGTGLPFRPATFDGCISISALQWLCYSNSSKQIPKKRLLRFFSSLYQVLRKGARAVLQFYPETPHQAVLISECAAHVGFAGGVVVDYPNSTKAKKHFLVLSFDRTYKPPAGLTDTSLLHTNHVTVHAQSKHTAKKHTTQKHIKKTKDWILHKKHVQRKQGKQVRPDSKYTGRKRSSKF